MIECNWGFGQEQGKRQAEDAVENNSGMYMYFNPHFDKDYQRAMSAFTRVLYGHDTRDTGIFYPTQW